MPLLCVLRTPHALIRIASLGESLQTIPRAGLLLVLLCNLSLLISIHATEVQNSVASTVTAATAH